MNLSKLTIRQITFALLIGMCLGILWYRLKGHSIQVIQAEQRHFPDFKLVDLTKEVLVTPKIYKDKITIVHVWGTWCGVCLDEYSELKRIKQKWPQYQWLGVTYRDDSRKVLDFIKKEGNLFDYLVNDVTGKLGIEIGLMGTPETFIVDKNGMIQFHYQGAFNVNEFEDNVLPSLNKLN